MNKFSEFLSTGTGVVALVFSMLGVCFALTGVLVLFVVQPIWLGLPFLGFGVVMFAIGRLLWLRRSGQMQQRQRLLSSGCRINATVEVVRQNLLVRMNGRQHPWVVGYHYDVNGQTHHNEETFVALPAGCVVGATMTALYDLEIPQNSTLLVKEH
jgi:hypothetical protein